VIKILLKYQVNTYLKSNNMKKIKKHTNHLRVQFKAIMIVIFYKRLTHMNKVIRNGI
jgi:hypothetical protein